MQVAHQVSRYAAEALFVGAICGAKRPDIAGQCAQAARHVALGEGE